MPVRPRRRWRLRPARYIVAIPIALVAIGIGVLHTPLGDYAMRRVTMQLETRSLRAGAG